MTPIQTLEIRAGEIRKRLADIGGMADLTDETRSELDKLKLEYSDNDSRRAALTIAGDAPVTHIETRSAEGREFRALVNKSSVGEIFDASLSKRSVDGASAELQQHYGLDPNQVPLALLVKAWPDADKLETRAVTPAPGDVGQEQQSIVNYVFPQSAASFLGVDMPTVGVGEKVFPVLTSELSVGTPAENAEQGETTGAFSADVLSPGRLQASFFYSREDRARFAGMDAALRENLSAGLADGLDKAILSGTNGLFMGTNLPDHNQTTNDTFDSYLNNLCWNQIDGRYAATPGDLALVVGAATLKDLGQTYRNTSVDRSALDRLMELTSGVRVSAHVPAPATNRQNAVIRRGMSMTAVAPVWEGITIIPDEVTKAKAGQIVITAVMLYAMKVLRTGAGLVKQAPTTLKGGAPWENMRPLRAV